MKVIPKNIESFIKNIPNSIYGILLYGADLGLISERVKIICANYLQEENNSENIKIIFDDNLKENPNLIEEEAFTSSLFGSNKKIIILKEGKDSYSKNLKSYFEAPNHDTLIIIQASDLGTASSLRKYCESADKIGTIPCYLDNQISLRTTILNILQQDNFQINNDALNFLLNNLGNDRSITINEINKLMLYTAKEKTITLEDAINSTSNNSAINNDKFIYALFNFETIVSYNNLQQLLNDETNPIAIVRILIIHVNKLIYVKSLSTNTSLDLAIKEVKPPIFFMYTDSFKRQVISWSLEKLKNLLNVLINLEISMKTNSDLGELLLKNLIIKVFTKN